VLLLTLSAFFIVSSRILTESTKANIYSPCRTRGVLSFRFCFLNLLVAPSSLSPSLSPSRLASRRLRRDDRCCPFLPLCFPPRLAASPAARDATRALHAPRPGPRCPCARPERTIRRNPRYRGRRAQGPLTCGLPDFVPEAGSFASSARQGPGPAFAPSWSAGPSSKVLRSSIAPASCSSLPTLVISPRFSSFVLIQALFHAVLPRICPCGHQLDYTGGG